MSEAVITSPLTFQPIFMERMWGGRRLETQFGKKLPPNVRIGESWEIVDRPEAQSVVRDGEFKGKTLHDLWIQRRRDAFGNLAEAPRLPLLIKLLDAAERLSLQVHPPKKAGAKRGDEPKTESWYVAAAERDAELFVGFRERITRAQFEKSVGEGSAADHVHRIKVKPGDAMFLPAGRFHAVGAGNLLIEIQQNSDTTYRVFDWNRVAEPGKTRRLHIDEALQSIDFTDAAPGLVEPKGEVLARHELFEIQRWNLDRPREVAPHGQFAIVYCING